MNEFNIVTAQVEATSRKEWLKNRRTAKASITISGGSSMPNTSSSTPTAPTSEKLSDLLDVSLTEPKKGDVLQHDGTEWKNSPLSDAFGDEYYTKKEIDDPLYGYVKRSEGGIIHEPIDVRGENSQVIVRSNYNDEYAVAEVVGAKVSEGVMGRLRWSPGQTDLTGEGDLYYNGEKVALGNGGGSGGGDYVSKRGDEMLGKLSIQASDTQLILIGEQNDARDYRAQIIAESVGERYGGISWSRSFTNIEGESGQLTYNGEPLATLIDVNDIVNQIQGGGGLVEKTYAEVKALRDSGQLVAGQFYRITDYVTTTKKVDTASANHPFDIITFAIDSSHLCEECWAAVHEGDTYFANSALESWKVWYCLDNDTNRFDWADTTNGKGVIYRLIDNYGNDCPYDFKNILFTRYLVTRVDEMSEFEYFYYGIKNSGSYYPHNCTISRSDRSTTFYTFSAFVDEDQTIDPSDLSIGIGNPSEVYGNIIRPCYSNKRQTLNNIVFAERNCHGNYIEENCSDMTIVRSVNNHIEASSECVFMFSSGYNRIGAGSNRISLAESYNNHIGYSSALFQLRACSYNVFGESCIDVIMGQYCSYNSLDGNNYYVRVYGGSDCNKLGKYCQFITLFENAKNNRFENTAFSCAVDGEDNTFEGYNQLVTLGYDGDRCIGRTVRKYNSGVHSRGIRAGYLEGFEVRYVLAWEDPEVEIDNANENTVTLAVYPFKVFVPEQSIMDGVSSWYCEMYDMSGALGYGGCDVEVGADGTVQSFRIDIPVEDYDAFINTEELEFEFMLYPFGDNGEQLYGSLGGVITTDESLYTFVYVWNPHFE